jgi:hypothetical protein
MRHVANPRDASANPSDNRCNKKIKRQAEQSDGEAVLC